jgi:hypothetical protein
MYWYIYDSYFYVFFHNDVIKWKKKKKNVKDKRPIVAQLAQQFLAVHSWSMAVISLPLYIICSIPQTLTLAPPLIHSPQAATPSSLPHPPPRRPLRPPPPSTPAIPFPTPSTATPSSAPSPPQRHSYPFLTLVPPRPTSGCSGERLLAEVVLPICGGGGSGGGGRPPDLLQRQTGFKPDILVGAALLASSRREAEGRAAPPATDLRPAHGRQLPATLVNILRVCSVESYGEKTKIWS